MNDNILFQAKSRYGELIESHSILQGEEVTYLRNETDRRGTWIIVHSETVRVFTGDFDGEGNKIFK